MRAPRSKRYRRDKTPHPQTKPSWGRDFRRTTARDDGLGILHGAALLSHSLPRVELHLYSTYNINPMAYILFAILTAIYYRTSFRNVRVLNLLPIEALEGGRNSAGCRLLWPISISYHSFAHDIVNYTHFISSAFPRRARTVAWASWEIYRPAGGSCFQNSNWIMLCPKTKQEARNSSYGPDTSLAQYIRSYQLKFLPSFIRSVRS